MIAACRGSLETSDHLDRLDPSYSRLGKFGFVRCRRTEFFGILVAFILPLLLLHVPTLFDFVLGHVIHDKYGLGVHLP
ncbi:hypothetical protein N7451_001800 [Penicillium sp. IBT 35674x]|nr:hypothetical protein N7451_001800 [Penicillium sp. IBT 35674x]